MNSALQVALLDLGLGNLRSVERALEQAAARRGASCVVTVTRDPSKVRSADRLVMPGQGAFRAASEALAGDFGDAVREAIGRGTPYFGICLGLQLLFESSEEAPDARGLGVLRGTNVRLDGEGVKIPHMGWNSLLLSGSPPPALEEACRESHWFYFVHSFHAAPRDEAVVVATATHGHNDVVSAISWRNVLATQFHPEKSQMPGLTLLGEFLKAGA